MTHSLSVVRQAVVALVIGLFTFIGSVEAKPTVNIKIEHPRIRWMPGDLPVAGYLSITNRGNETIKLVGATGPGFRRIELHKSMGSGGMEQMKSMSEIVIKAGQTLHFKPGGYHLMMWRLQPLKPDQTTPVVLKFSNGATKNVTFFVGGPATG